MTIVRGAISSENSVCDISSKAVELYNSLVDANSSFKPSFLLITHTKDLTAYNSCKALRDSDLCTDIPMECVQEAYIEGQMLGIIRMSVFFDASFIPRHIYLRKATALRPDISK